jgi:hypothetical protein
MTAITQAVQTAMGSAGGAGGAAGGKGSSKADVQTQILQELSSIKCVLSALTGQPVGVTPPPALSPAPAEGGESGGESKSASQISLGGPEEEIGAEAGHTHVHIYNAVTNPLRARMEK